jgi:hypothetical protein
MSGPLSVPAAVAAALVSNSVARVVLACTAVACFIFSSYWIWRVERQKRDEAESALAQANDFSLTQWGNVRVADNPAALDLFDKHGTARNKFLSLLNEDLISCWARPMTAGQSDLVRVIGQIWKSGYFHFAPKSESDPRAINQTYLRDRRTNNAIFYDLYLNITEMRRIWPTIELMQATEEKR